MGHDIRACTDEKLTQEIAGIRVFPSEAFFPGNIYETLGATEHRNSCSGDGKVVHRLMPCDEGAGANPQTQEFLEIVCAYLRLHELDSCYIQFG